MPMEDNMFPKISASGPLQKMDPYSYREIYRHNSRINEPKIMKLKQKACPDCRLRWHPSVMTFDHLDRSTKSFNVYKVMWYEPEIFDAEMAKGEFVCQNCHIVRELKRDRPLKNKFKDYYLRNLSIRGGILRQGVKDIDYKPRY